MFTGFRIPGRAPAPEQQRIGSTFMMDFDIKDLGTTHASCTVNSVIPSLQGEGEVPCVAAQCNERPGDILCDTVTTTVNGSTLFGKLVSTGDALNTDGGVAGGIIFGGTGDFSGVMSGSLEFTTEIQKGVDVDVTSYQIAGSLVYM